MASAPGESSLAGGPGFGAHVPGGTALKPMISRPLRIAFIIGDVLGAGIYALVGEVAGEVGGAIWTAFLGALVLALFTAASYAELVTKYPRAAGAALYVNRAFKRPFLTFLVAFAVMCSGLTSAATLATAFGGDYLSEFVTLPNVLVAVVFLAVLAAINFRGIKESVTVNLGLTLIEVTGLVLVVVIGLAFLLDGGGDPGRALEFKEGQAVPLAILAGISLAFYALIGFEDSVNVAEETDKPSRAFPIALFGGLFIAGLVYMLVTFTASMIVPTDELAASDGPLLEVVRQGPLDLPLKLFAAVALMAVANGALLNMVMASRLVYGMSTQGIIPRALGHVHSGRRTPYVAIIFTTILGLILIVTGDLSTLAGVTVTLLLFVFIVVNATVLVLRRDKVAHEHFHAPTILPILGVIVCIGLLTQREADVWWRAGALLALGVVLFAINRAVSGPPQDVDADRIG